MIALIYKFNICVNILKRYPFGVLLAAALLGSCALPSEGREMKLPEALSLQSREVALQDTTVHPSQESGRAAVNEAEIKETLQALYRLMEEKETYMSAKEEQIAGIRKMLAIPRMSEEQRYDINLRLFNEFKTYIADSAIYYAKENIEIGKKLQSTDRIYDSMLDLASLNVISGMYFEASDLLSSFERDKLTLGQLIKYYDSYKQLYRNYAFNNPYATKYAAQSNLYRDSLLQILDPSSHHYLIVYAEKLYDENRLDASRQILLTLLSKTRGDTHEKAVLCYALGNIYQKEGNSTLQKYYYALSSISDIKNAIKENASMQALALTLFKEGEIDRAYTCIKSSMEDAMFCNARLRTYEISTIFPIIDSAYQQKLSKQKDDLESFLRLSNLLLLFLIVAIFIVWRQMRKVARIRKELYHTNLKLRDLNDDLQKSITQLNLINSKMQEVNAELSEANKIKETYIGQLLDLCSTYINKLENYQHTLNKKAMERKLDELFGMLKSRDMIDRELRELYQLFDHTFLSLYPTFVEEFNALLREEERFILKPGELLNVELRIFALIRLGITDSSRIAGFLHYSANTIYNYRARVRNKAAVSRDQFEHMVMKIGVIQRM